MGLTGEPRSNFSSNVLRIELNGPTRSYFGILDVPGIFHALIGNVTEEEKQRVEALVISHMKNPGSVIMCILCFSCGVLS
jgi:hypothetical protein